jgi:hypothetical protein
LATEATERQQSSASTTIIPPPVADRSEHRAALQATVDDIGELVWQFNNLAVEERDQRFREAAANIPPSQGRHGRRVVARRRGQTGGQDQETPVQETQQDARGLEIVVGSSPTVPHTQGLVLGRAFPAYPSLDAVADAVHERTRLQSLPGGPSPDSIVTGASTLTIPTSS